MPRTYGVVANDIIHASAATWRAFFLRCRWALLFRSVRGGSLDFLFVVPRGLRFRRG